VQPDVVESALRVGESTSADVLKVLGEPLGKGRAMLPIDPQPRTLWAYFYAEGDLNDSRGMFLFVYFLRDRYDGYMWFSSLPDVRDKAAISQSPETQASYFPVQK
jgi:hypothetical protein